jgi:agmatine deiminase
MPAEWEPHRATWLAWPHEKTDWPGKFDAIRWVFCEIMRALQEGERIRLIVDGKAGERSARSALQKSGVSLKAVDFHHVPTDRSWLRDSAPTFVTARAPEKKRGALAAVKFRFNGWARYNDHKKDDAVGVRIADALGVARFEPVVTLGRKSHRFVLEGGAIDVDGEGTLIATKECLLDGKQARNPELGRGLTEAVLRDYLGADKVIWLARGVAGDDTGGHIDDFARFVKPATVVVAVETKRKDPNFRPLSEAREQLNGARDARGRKLEVIPLPMPAPLSFAGQRLPASYANFYVANAAVLVPTFNDPSDRIALGILGELFPNREVRGIHAGDFVLGLGTLHCTTQQEPQP